MPPTSKIKFIVDNAFQAYSTPGQSWRNLLNSRLPLKPGEFSSIIDSIEDKNSPDRLPFLLFSIDILHQLFLLNEPIKSKDLARLFRNLKSKVSKSLLPNILEHVFFNDSLDQGFRLRVARFLLENQKTIFDILQDLIDTKIPIQSFAYLSLLEKRIKEKKNLNDEIRRFTVFLITYFLRCLICHETIVMQNVMSYLSESSIPTNQIKELSNFNLKNPNKSIKKIEAITKLSLEKAFKKIISITSKADEVCNVLNLSNKCSEMLRGTLVITFIQEIDSFDDKDRVCEGIIKFLVVNQWTMSGIKSLSKRVSRNLAYNKSSNLLFFSIRLLRKISLERRSEPILMNLISIVITDYKQLIPYLSYYHSVMNLDLTKLRIENDLINSLEDIKEEYKVSILSLEEKIEKLEKSLKNRFWDEYKESEINRLIQNIDSRKEYFYSTEIVKKENALLEKICTLHSRIFYHEQSKETMDSFKIETQKIMSKYHIKQFDEPGKKMTYNPNEYNLMRGKYAKVVKVITPAYFREIDGEKKLLKKGTVISNK